MRYSTYNQQIGENIRKSFQIMQNVKHLESIQKQQQKPDLLIKMRKLRFVPSIEMVVSADMPKFIMLPRLPGLKQAIF